MTEKVTLWPTAAVWLLATRHETRGEFGKRGVNVLRQQLVGLSRWVDDIPKKIIRARSIKGGIVQRIQGILGHHCKTVGGGIRDKLVQECKIVEEDEAQIWVLVLHAGEGKFEPQR